MTLQTILASSAVTTSKGWKVHEGADEMWLAPADWQESSIAKKRQHPAPVATHGRPTLKSQSFAPANARSLKLPLMAQQDLQVSNASLQSSSASSPRAVLDRRAHRYNATRLNSPIRSKARQLKYDVSLTTFKVDRAQLLARRNLLAPPQPATLNLLGPHIPLSAADSAIFAEAPDNAETARVKELHASGLLSTTRAVGVLDTEIKLELEERGQRNHNATNQ